MSTLAEPPVAAEQDLLDENPLVEGLERLPVHPTTLVIFGATGDLVHRKLLPALYNLMHDGAPPECFGLVGVTRREHLHEDCRQMVRESISRSSRRPPDPDVLDGLIANVRYVPGTFDDARVYAELVRTLNELDEQSRGGWTAPSTSQRRRSSSGRSPASSAWPASTVRGRRPAADRGRPGGRCCEGLID